MSKKFTQAWLCIAWYTTLGSAVRVLQMWPSCVELQLKSLGKITLLPHYIVSWFILWQGQAGDPEAMAFCGHVPHQRVPVTRIPQNQWGLCPPFTSTDPLYARYCTRARFQCCLHSYCWLWPDGKQLRHLQWGMEADVTFSSSGLLPDLFEILLQQGHFSLKLPKVIFESINRSSTLVDCPKYFPRCIVRYHQDQH